MHFDIPGYETILHFKTMSANMMVKRFRVLNNSDKEDAIKILVCPQVQSYSVLCQLIDSLMH